MINKIMILIVIFTMSACKTINETDIMKKYKKGQSSTKTLSDYWKKKK
tara:strand:- start:263 stop:406 length:144 start_codon:yes stop_codon:yes gene_type:complete